MRLKKIIYPYGLQALTLSAVVIFFILTSQENPFAEVNIGILLFWKLWWPLIPFIVLFLGRFWCSICPFSTIANIVKRIFPYTLVETDWFRRHGLYTSILFYLLLVIVNVAFSIESNAFYTTIFVSGMIVFMLLMIVIFGYSSYCYGACPMGLFLTLYEPAIFSRLDNNNPGCEQCKKKSWIQEIPLLTIGEKKEFEERNWRFGIECLKKCRKKSTVIKFKVPFRDWQKGSAPSLIETFAPSIVLLIFSVSLFEKSNFFLYYYEQFTAVFPINLSLFNLLSIPFIIVVITGVNVLFFLGFCRLTSIEPTVISRKFRGLVILLIMFHLALVLGEFAELEVLFQKYPTLDFFQIKLLNFNTEICVPCVLTLFGIIISFLYGLSVANKSGKLHLDWRRFGLSLFLFTIYLAQSAFFAIVTLKLLPYTAC